jgi:hypothetical protein
MNPNLNRFLAENPDIGLLGFAWACYWRLSLAIGTVYVALIVVIMVLSFGSTY